MEGLPRLVKSKNIKLIAIDLDGTLLNSNHLVSKRNRQALEAAQKKGIQIVLCTGRPLRSMKHILADINLLNDENIVVTYNGGLIKKSKTEEIIEKNIFEKKEILDIYKLSHHLKFPISLIDLDNIYEPPHPIGQKSIYGRNDIGIPKQNQLNFLSVDPDNLPDKFEIQSVIISRPKEEINIIAEEIPPDYFKKYNIYRSHHHILEILPLKVDKGYSINQIGKYLDIKKEEIMGIGDQENDISLIENSGIGVAMGNAVDEVKEIADYITKSNNDDGVAYAINEFILKE